MAREGVKVTRLRYDGSGVVTSDELFSLTCQLLVPYHVCMYCNSSIVKIVGKTQKKMCGRNWMKQCTCTCTVHVLSKQIQFQNFQERCAQHGAFQRTTRIIKHRTPSYIGTQKTRDFFKRWCKRAKIESKNHDNVVNLVLY